MAFFCFNHLKAMEDKNYRKKAIPKERLTKRGLVSLLACS